MVIEIQLTADEALRESEFVDAGIVSAGILEDVPMFPYLHKKHLALVSQAAAILKAMKQDGTYDRLDKEAKATTRSQDIRP